MQSLESNFLGQPSYECKFFGARLSMLKADEDPTQQKVTFLSPEDRKLFHDSLAATSWPDHMNASGTARLASRRADGQFCLEKGAAQEAEIGAKACDGKLRISLLAPDGADENPKHIYPNPDSGLKPFKRRPSFPGNPTTPGRALAKTESAKGFSVSKARPHTPAVTTATASAIPARLTGSLASSTTREDTKAVEVSITAPHDADFALTTQHQDMLPPTPVGHSFQPLPCLPSR